MESPKGVIHVPKLGNKNSFVTQFFDISYIHDKT